MTRILPLALIAVLTGTSASCGPQRDYAPVGSHFFRVSESAALEDSLPQVYLATRDGSEYRIVAGPLVRNSSHQTEVVHGDIVVYMSGSALFAMRPGAAGVVLVEPIGDWSATEEGVQTTQFDNSGKHETALSWQEIASKLGR